MKTNTFLSFLLPVLLFFIAPWSYSQSSYLLKGKIVDEQGEPMAFATVYIKGTSKGTSTNNNGEYQLPVEKGPNTIAYQYVGYATQEINIDISERTTVKDVQLKPAAFELSEVVVKADAEDPAYPIIRQAMAKREYYRKQVKAFSVDVYIKGIQKVLGAPKKIFGQEVGDMGGNLDSTGKGVIYLSESFSNWHYREPDQYKEIQVASKVSGNDNGISFNNASILNFSFYDPLVEILSPMVSPIASNAFGYYRYKLIGSNVQNERLVYKIQVLPKRPDDPVFGGFLYINDGLFNIAGIDLFTTGRSIKQEVLDTLYLRQEHAPISKDVWRVFNNVIQFKAGIFGFQFGGTFTGVYKNWNLDPEFNKKFFNREVWRIEDDANKQDTAFWINSRPIPLTQEEIRDYAKKDSLKIIWNSREYKDSMDRKNNKFQFINLLTGYTWNNSWKRKSFSISSPLQSLQFNVVQGYNLGTTLTYRQEYDDFNGRWWSVSPMIQYGIDDKNFRWGLSGTYQHDAVRKRRINIALGDKIVFFNPGEPISYSVNSLLNVYLKKNPFVLIRETGGNISYRQELLDGFSGRIKLNWYEINSQTVNTQKSWRKKDALYDANTPVHPLIGENVTLDGRVASAELQLRYQPGQTYFKRPGRRDAMGSKWPVFTLDYTISRPWFNTDNDFDQLALTVTDTWEWGLPGYTRWRLNGGSFLNSQRMLLREFQQFGSARWALPKDENYLNMFFQLPYNSFATNSQWVQAHLEHHFRGWIFDKIPLIKRLAWDLVVSGKTLYTPENGWYHEVGVGIDNIGFKLFRPLRLDVVWTSTKNNALRGPYLNVGFELF